MEKSKLAITTDEMLRAAAIWLFSAICLRYVIKQLYLIIIFATAITMLLTLLLRLYYGKKSVAKKNIKLIDDVMSELIAADHSVLANKLCSAMDGEVAGGAVIAQNTLVYPYFLGKLPLDKLNYAYNLALEKNKKLIVLCLDTTREVENYIGIFSKTAVAILRKKDSYDFLKKYELLPKVVERPKKKLHLIKSALRKSKIKGYLTAALFLLITAAFSPYALICIIFAAVNITLSILCEVKGT